MRKKELKLIVTFHTTADAMALEKAAKQEKLKGRLIPVPRELSSGCGMSWKSEIEDKEKLLAVMKETGIELEELHECMV
ncbi:MAG TPA: DUF3343 domain-containing protein [Candidatus Dorea intestinavium]|nr:DUF3343 domain-containing protein [Candidatus Dorea intestinavium]